MIRAKKLINFLKIKKINFFTGVPDSVTKEFSIEIKKNKSCKNIITSNEGSSIALASGYYLAQKKIPCVYLQNSGLGNAINPLSSICHKKVYSIPILILIGWRGSPSYKDEPQHEVMGKITKKILNLLKIKFCVLKNEKDFKSLNKLIINCKKNKEPVACLIERKVFVKKKEILNNYKDLNLTRSDFIKNLLKKIKKNTKLVSTTGYTSRELIQIRKEFELKSGQDFYMVGGMGHASTLASGYSLYKKKPVICIDGDGSFLMHLGSLHTNARVSNKNFKHILINNYSHESVGGQKTHIESINIKKLVLSLGYKKYFMINSKSQLNKIIPIFLRSNGPIFLEVKVKKYSLKNLLRPNNLKLIKNNFMI